MTEILFFEKKYKLSSKAYLFAWTLVYSTENILLHFNTIVPIFISANIPKNKSLVTRFGDLWKGSPCNLP